MTLSGASFRYKTDLQQLCDDIVKTAYIADVPYDLDTIWRVLNTYKDFFAGSSVAFRTTTKAKEHRGLNVRYVELGVQHDPYRMALSDGLLVRQAHPMDDLLPEFQSRFPILGYGVDFEVTYGLEKIWTFFSYVRQTVESLFSLSNLPDGIRDYAAYFARHDLRSINVLGIDYRHRSMNLYFPMEEPNSFPQDKIAAMIADLNFEVPPEEILTYCSMANPVYFTFSWDTSRIERICFAIVTSDHKLIPRHLDPLIERFFVNVPFSNSDRTFIFNPTFSPNGYYLKIENDYTPCKWE
jgi:hypothetical protein